ncbi:MAG: hypothetical protein KF729_07640 [Sandaracinaceae bacterium]|nr:hypothetical protein [Sandaracinaceae bacterium]
MKNSISLLLLLASACNDPNPSSPEDAGSAPADAGVMTTDATMPAPDAGEVGTDAGLPDAGAPVDAGPATATASCDALPATVASGRTDDVYYSAVQVCGTPGAACTVREDALASCAEGVHVLVGYDFTDAAQVRVQNDWTIASASAGSVLDERWHRSIPLDEEASVVLRAPGGARYTLTFTVGFEAVRIVSFAEAP